MKKSFIVFSLFAAANVCAEDKTKPFKMDGEFGLIATSGNTNTTSVKGKLSAHHELEKWSNDFIFEALYKKDEVTLTSGDTETQTTETQTTAQKYFLSGQGNYKLEDPNHRLFVFGSYEDNKFSSYDYQSTIAAGWSQKLWEDEISKFEYSIGPGYSFAKLADGTSENGFIVRGALNYQWKISDSATFTQLLSTEIGEFNTKSKSETSVSAKINGDLSLKISLMMDHNSDVLGDRKNLDTQIAATVVYSFF